MAKEKIIYFYFYYIQGKNKANNSVESSILIRFCMIGSLRITEFYLQTICFSFSWVFTHCNFSWYNLGSLSS